MKTKFFLPVIAMLSLMLLSFTTNNESSYSIVQLANGNFLLHNVPLSQEDVSTMDGIVANFMGDHSNRQESPEININDQLNDEESIARAWWFARNETWTYDKNEKKTGFTERTIAGGNIAPPGSGGDDIIRFELARAEINAIMHRYMK